MTGIQLIALLVAVVMTYITYTSFRRHELRASELALWTAIWVGLALVSLFPGLPRAVIAPLAVARLLDLVMIGGILLLGIIVFTLNRSLRRLENRLTALVEHLAMQSARESARDRQGGREEGVDDQAEGANQGAAPEDLRVREPGRK
jgi:hypothetical protein